MPIGEIKWNKERELALLLREQVVKELESGMLPLSDVQVRNEDVKSQSACLFREYIKTYLHRSFSKSSIAFILRTACILHQDEVIIQILTDLKVLPTSKFIYWHILNQFAR